MGEIMWTDPKHVKLIDGADPRDFPFWDFLRSEARTKLQIQKTGYFKWYKNHLKIGTHSDRINGIKAEKGILERLRYLQKLNELIRNDKFFQDVDKIQVFIDCRGHIRVFEGRHRLICALYNGCDNIPLEVIYRHPDWESFKDSLSKEYTNNKVLYNPIDHPDFNGWPVLREPRINIIERALNAEDFYPITDRLSKEKPGYHYKISSCHYFQRDHAERLKGLDLGCHIGYMCHYLERYGAQMTGVEHCLSYYDKAVFLSQVYELNPTFCFENIHDFVGNTKAKYDFVIALSVFYFLFRQDENKARKLLTKISEITDMMFIDDCPKELPEERLLQEIADHTDFTVKVIFAGQNGRKIFQLTKLENKSGE